RLPIGEGAVRAVGDQVAAGSGHVRFDADRADADARLAKVDLVTGGVVDEADPREAVAVAGIIEGEQGAEVDALARLDRDVLVDVLARGACGGAADLCEAVGGRGGNRPEQIAVPEPGRGGAELEAR